jgi:cytochrome c-type biogenesis protein CcmF
MISEAVWHEKVTVGPPYYNAWVQPLGLMIFALMGIGTLFGWKKTSTDALKKAFRLPIAAFFAVLVLHFAIGNKIGYPAVVYGDKIYPGVLGVTLQGFNAHLPVAATSLAAFNIAVIVQEFAMLFAARRSTGADKSVPAILWWAGFLPGFVLTMVTLPPASRRRYGGYIVHFGLALMILGFNGKSWNVDKETTLSPGQTYQVERLTLEYAGPRMEVDNSKRMVFADIKVSQAGKPLGTLQPAKFIYKKMPESPTTEVSMLHSVRDDLYLVVGTINPQTKTASLQIHLNPLVSWIWFGAVVLGIGAFFCMWPELAPEESRVSRAWAYARGAAAVASSIMVGFILALMPHPAFAQATSSLHSGTVHIEDPVERDIFGQLRCMCGGCQRLPLSSCACGDADDYRAAIRAKIKAGEARDQIIMEYARQYGSDAIVVPPNEGALRTIYAVPLAAIVGGGVGLGVLIRRWRKPKTATEPAKAEKPANAEKRDEYDARLDEELKDIDG